MENELYVQWHITNQCRNRCLHCYQKRYDGESVTLEQADFILKNIRRCGKELEAEPYIVITGGDPFENSNFYEILRRSLRISRRVGILGNPEPIIRENGKDARFLAELKIDSYQLSVDGMQRTHDMFRYKGSFRKTIKAIEVLRKAGVWVNIMSTVSFVNYQEMADVMKTVYDCGANFWTFTRYAPAQSGHCGISPRDFMAFLSEITEELKPYEAQGKPQQTRNGSIRRKSQKSHPELEFCHQACNNFEYC